MSNQRRLIISIGLVVLIVAGGWFAFSYFGQSSVGNQQSGDQQVVATVNGESISQQELDVQVERLKQQTNSTSSGQLEEQALEQLVSNVLVRQEAEKEGIEITDEEINQEIESLKQSLGEDTSYEEQLKAAGMTQKEHKELLKEQLLTNKYLETQISEDQIEVTDEQLQQAYDQMSTQQDLPSLEKMDEQMKEQLRSQVAQQQQSQLIQELISSLREEADIETSL